MYLVPTPSIFSGRFCLILGVNPHGNPMGFSPNLQDLGVQTTLMDKVQIHPTGEGKEND